MSSLPIGQMAKLLDRQEREIFKYLGDSKMQKLTMTALLTSSVLLAACSGSSSSGGDQDPGANNNGLDPINTPTTNWYKDADGDGYGDPEVVQVGDQPDSTWVEDNTDCDDDPVNGVAINPEANELNTDQIDSDCDGVFSVPPFTIGETGPAGGVLYDNYLTTWYEASPVDLLDGNGAEWGCSGINVPGASSVSNGPNNTSDIVAAMCSAAVSVNDVAANAADEYVLNGYDDWYLPARGELQELYEQRQYLASYDSGFYWSSTEDSTTIAWGVSLTTGQISFAAKTNVYQVRAVRTFEVPASP